MYIFNSKAFVPGKEQFLQLEARDKACLLFI